VSPDIGLIVCHLSARRIGGGYGGKIDQKIFLRGPTGLTQFKPSNGAMPAPRPVLRRIASSIDLADVEGRCDKV
jgi:hypothetical protein